MITKGKRDIGIAAIAVVALLAIGFGRGRGSDADSSKGSADGEKAKTDLRICYFPNLTHAPALIGIARGTIASELPGYNVTTKVVNAGPEAMEALLAGAIDVAYVGPSPAVNTYVKTEGSALRIIAGACSGGASLVARADVGIHSIKDLANHRVAVPQLGGTQDVSLRHFLEENGLDSKDHRGTVDVISAKNPDILSLMKQKEIDAAWVPEPWASRLRAEAGAQTVVDERDLWPDHKFTTTVLVIGSKFADAHPDVVAALVKANQTTIDWINSNPAEAQKAANDELKRLSGKSLKEEVLKEAWSKLTFTTDPNMASILAMAQSAHVAGYLKAEPRGLEAMYAAPATATGAK